MAAIKISKKEIAKYLKITPDLAEKISLMGIPVESETEQELEIEVLPNRPDVLSVQGLLRVLASYSEKEPGLKRYKVNPPEKNYRIAIDESVKNVRPYTACAIIKGLSFDDSKIKEIIELQEKLHTTLGRNRKRIAIGIYPLEKIKMPIKYEAKKPDNIKFIPLESSQEMNGLQILQKHPTGREYASLLEGMEKFPVFIDSNNKVLSMPPIINSNETGKITNETKEVFIECSGFQKEILQKTINIITTTLADMGGKIYSLVLEYPKKEKILTPDLSPEKMKISLSNVNKLLGLNLKEKEVEKLLAKMGHNYGKGKVEIPAWRTDILHEVDLIEDIAIAYGYDKLVPEIPKVATTAQESTESRASAKMSQILIGLGLIETSSYHLIKQEEKDRMSEEGLLELEKSKTEYKFLRPNLLISILRILAENKDREYPQKIFEIGTVFSRSEETETGIKEIENLIIAASPSNFTEIKQIADYLFKMLGIGYSLQETKTKELIEGRTAQIIVNHKLIGHIGDVHPKILKDWNIKMPVSLLEISLEEIFKILEQSK